MEETDLSKNYPDIVKRLKAKLDFEHSEAVDPLPDRWASLMSMMKGNYAVPSPGGGYEAALGHWMEPEHIKNVNFFRKAYAWIRLTSLDIGSKIVFPQLQVHKNPTSADNHYNDNNEYTDIISKEERIEISNALLVAFGLNKAQRISQQHLEAIKYKLKLLEKYYGTNLKYDGNRNEGGIKMPRSKM